MIPVLNNSTESPIPATLSMIPTAQSSVLLFANLSWLSPATATNENAGIDSVDERYTGDPAAASG